MTTTAVAAGRGGLRAGVPSWAITAALALTWLLVNPPTPDLAAHEYRAEIARRVGFGVWEQGWYAGHHLPGYSVLMPPLAALLSPQAVGAICAVIATWCFDRLAAAHWPAPAARMATLWFAAGVISTLVGGQLAFAAGLAPGLGALLAARRGRFGAAAALGAVTTLTSPVVAAFLVLAATAWLLADHARGAIWVGAGAIVPGLAIAAAFSEGGVQPFAFSSFFWSFAVAVGAAILLPADERTLRTGAVLYALALVAGVVVDTPLGGNLVRLAAVFGGPIAAGALWDRRMTVLAIVALPLLYWQWLAPVRSVVRGAGDRSSHLAYHAPLIAELDRRAAAEGPFRTEVPFTANHWETRFVAPDHPLARGWERQLDVKVNPLFYGHGVLTPARYRRWLDRLAVRYVALPDVQLDPSGAAEGRLVRGGTVPGVVPVWHDRHWRLFRVTDAQPLADPPVRVTRMGVDDVALTTPRPATSTVRVRFSPYWALDGAGCVERGFGGWTRVRLDRAGPSRLRIRFTPARIGATGPRCEH